MGKKRRSSAWSAAEASGEPYVLAGPPCLWCGGDAHPTYTAAGVCFDCRPPAGRFTRGRRRQTSREDVDRPKPRPLAATLPLVSAVVLAKLTADQRQMYAEARRGETAAAMARTRGVSRPAVAQALRRLAERLAASAR